MKFRLLLIVLLAIGAGGSIASSALPELKAALHQASKNIEKHADYEKINGSLYDQIRPRANITIEGIGQREVDEKVRVYVKQQYVPVLIDNYSKIYAELIEANKDYSTCQNPEPVNPGKEVLKALCIQENGDTVNVQYMTNGYSRGWSKALVFAFHHEGNEAELVAISLQLKEGARAYVPGI